jgi:hypothetical protein
MIFNDQQIEINGVEAYFIIRKNSRDTFIRISSKDEKRIAFTISDKEFDPSNLELNKKIDLIKHIYWDVTLVTKDTYYLFDITKEKIELTRLEDNKYNIKVNIENPDMIYSPLGNDATFNNLNIDTNFSFIYEDKE